MTFSGAELQAAVSDAIRPTPGELATARSVILEALSGAGSLHAGEFVTRLQTLAGIGPSPAREIQLERDTTASTFLAPDRDVEPLKLIRIQASVRESLASLWRDGVIMPVTGSMHGEDIQHVSVRWQGQGGSVQVHTREPLLPLAQGSQHRWALVNQDDQHPAEVLSSDQLVSGLEELLGRRGLRTLREAHAAYRRRLYLAAGNLLGAASEAAWLRIGLALQGRQDVDKALKSAAQGAIGALIDAGAVALRERVPSRLRSRLSEVAAHGHYLRDVRNYGVHPGEDHDEDREVPFSEAGAAVLLLQSRRYLVTLAEIHAAIASAT